MEILLIILLVAFILPRIASIRHAANWKANAIIYTIAAAVMACILVVGLMRIRSRADILMIAIDAFLAFWSVMNAISFFTKKKAWRIGND